MANERETVSLQGMIRWALAECAAREIDALPDIQELNALYPDTAAFRRRVFSAIGKWKKQEKRRALLDAAYELFLERGTSKTSVEDITSRAKVGKGTFYLYFADKGSVTQALLARVSYQLLDNACAAAEQHAAELTSFPDQMIFVIDHIIEALRADTLMLRFLERSFVWPGLDQIEASGEAEPLMRKVLQIVMCSPEMAGRTEREIYQRITALGSMCMSVCYTSVLEGKPDNIDNMKPILYDIIRRAL